MRARGVDRVGWVCLKLSEGVLIGRGVGKREGIDSSRCLYI